MDICDKKNKIQDLLNDIFNEYNRMNETKIQSKCEANLEMRTMTSTIRSLEESNVEKDNEVRSLKKTVHEYEIMINDLQSKFELAEEDEKENNKFDMLRIQAKEISEKSREIDRLNGLLNHHKSKDKGKKIDKVLETVQEKDDQSEVQVLEVQVSDIVDPVTDVVDPVTEEENPNLTYSEQTESDPPPHGSIKDEDEDEGFIIKAPLHKFLLGVPVEQLEAEYQAQAPVEPDKGKLRRFTSKGIKYFVYEKENPQQLYEFNDDKLCEKVVGTRKKNEKGKYKVQLFTS
jgi:hypothetical protein